MRRRARLAVHRVPPPACSERNPMNRIGLPLGLAALLVSFSASAVRVPTGSDDINLNVNVFLQARYEGTFEGSVEKSLDSDFFLRRARIQVSGTAYKTLSFLIQTDNSQMGKRGTPASIGNGANGAAGTPAFVQDLVIGWTPIEDFTLEMGLLLTPTSRILGYSASGGQVQVEAPIDIIFQNLDRGFRQNGAEARGFLLARRIHYRVGVWEGFHSTASVAAVAANPATATPVVGAFLSAYKYGSDSGNVHTSDRRKIAGGVAWFIKGQADKITLELNNITPGAPGNPAAIAPVASNGGFLTALSTTAIWLQGQAGF